MANQPLNILVIEDNEPDVLLIGEALQSERLDYQITHYRDGEEALAHLKSGNPEGSAYDLVILDLNMPRIGGLDVLAHVRKNPEFEQVPFLVLTSSLAPDDQKEAKRLGADRYLRKPSDLYEFLTDVGTAVRTMVVHE